MASDYPAHLLARDPAPPMPEKARSSSGISARIRRSAGSARSRSPPIRRVRRWSGPSIPGTHRCSGSPGTARAAASGRPRRRPRQDRDRFFGQTDAPRIHVTESGWLRRLQEARLFAYELPIDGFRPHDVGGYWITDQPVEAIGQEGQSTIYGQARRRRDRAADHAVDLAVLAAGRELDRRVQRPAAAQRRPAPGPVRLGQGRSSLSRCKPTIPRPAAAGPPCSAPAPRTSS